MHLLETETALVNIEVNGGKGERGRDEGYEKAVAIADALNLIIDTTVNGSLYLKICTESRPYPVRRANQVGDNFSYDYTWIFGVECTRYFGGASS